MGALSIWHWAIVLIALILLFGSKRLPDAARGVGRSLRIFKSEIKEMSGDDNPVAPEAAAPATPAQLPAAAVTPPVVAPQAVTPQAVTPQVVAPPAVPSTNETSGS
ncbi:Sec-independent protein translocase subunit TatA [Tomitella biformata]|uniref:Sec-independent protein translocase subunit TatA n=1 Tax=Tomitella biformata TaxID=630403 RepID=UPI000463C3EF|nr:Sec-independent protein translocase subunit TatA [Tomitella biformata]